MTTEKMTARIAAVSGFHPRMLWPIEIREGDVMMDASGWRYVIETAREDDDKVRWRSWGSGREMGVAAYPSWMRLPVWRLDALGSDPPEVTYRATVREFRRAESASPSRVRANELLAAGWIGLGFDAVNVPTMRNALMPMGTRDIADALSLHWEIMRQDEPRHIPLMHPLDTLERRSLWGGPSTPQQAGGASRATAAVADFAR